MILGIVLLAGACFGLGILAGFIWGVFSTMLTYREATKDEGPDVAARVEARVKGRDVEPQSLRL